MTKPRIRDVPRIAEWAPASISREPNATGDLNMDVAKFVLFIVACAFEFGLMVFLFRDQIFSQTDAFESEKGVNLT